MAKFSRSNVPALIDKYTRKTSGPTITNLHGMIIFSGSKYFLEEIKT